jgi:dinuclear metal center YbgI/SA1388 family protein
MQLAELVKVLEEIAPSRLAEAWDNVGLLAGDPAAPVTKALLTIDYTARVAEEGRLEGCDAVIAYHPPIFQPLKRLVAGSPVYDAIRRGVALYSLHTALDIAEGGTNDLLADLLGLVDRGPLRSQPARATYYKLVVFVPEADVDRVSQALFAAGAGWIGNYSSCSFRAPGTGTFFGEEGTNPAVGQRGRLELAPELRVETVLPIDRVEPVLKALRDTHPYEEPAFDLVQLAAPPDGRGMGRVGSLPDVPRARLFQQIKQGLGIDHLLVAGPLEGPVRRAAVGAGACGDLVNEAIARRVDLYLTGELRHHDALRAAEAGVTVVCALHSNSERAVLERVRGRLAERLPGLELHVSRCDADPFRVA